MMSTIPQTSPPQEDGEGHDQEENVTISRRELAELRSMASDRSERRPEPDLNVKNMNEPSASFDHSPGNEKDASKPSDRGAEIERAYRSAILERELATILANQSLVAGAASQLVKLWRDELTIIEDDGTIKIQSKDGRNVKQAVSDWLAAPEYSHFCRATSRGGSGTEGSTANHAGRTNPTPQNLGEMALNRWRETRMRSGSADDTPGWGRKRL